MSDGGTAFRFSANAAKAALQPCPIVRPGSIAPAVLPAQKILTQERTKLSLTDSADGWAAWASSYEREESGRPAFSPSVKFVLRFVVCLLLSLQIATTILIAVSGAYDMSMFTFWNYTLLTIYFTLLLAALFYERWLLTIAFAVLPVLLGTTFIISVAIVIIVQRNADIFLGDGSTSVSTRHTGDWLVHYVPPFEMVLLFAIGLGLYARRVIGYRIGLFRTRTRRAIFYVYWMLSPLVPFAIYSAAFDIGEKYPTGIPTGILWVLLIVVCVVWMTFWLVVFYAHTRVMLDIVVFSMGRTGAAHVRALNSALGDCDTRRAKLLTCPSAV